MTPEQIAAKEREDQKRQQRRERDKEREEERRRRNLTEAERMFEEGQIIVGTHAAAYLQARGLIVSRRWIVDLRFAPRLPYFGFPDARADQEEELGLFPAMLAAIRDHRGNLIGVHRTFLDPDKPLKLRPPGDLKRNGSKKIFGEAKGGLIRLSPPAPLLAIGEGIESSQSWYALGRGGGDFGIAAGVALGNISGRAAGSIAHRTRRDKGGKPIQIPNGVPAEDDPGIILPDGVEEAILLGDGDSDRQSTLMRLLTGARRFQAQGKRVFIDMAPLGKDWNTVLTETPETEQADPDVDHGNIQGIEDFAAMIRREDLEAYTSKFAATWFHQIGAKKPQRNWLLKNLLLSHVFGLVYGGPNGGKSFLTTDLALSAALAAVRGTSVDWFGHKTKGFGTIYLVAEGREDFEIRLHAWRTENGVKDDEVLPFVFLPTTIDLRSSEEDVKKLIEEVKVLSAQMQERCRVPASLIVVDTVARALAGGNENASEVMGAFVINCDRLKDETGCTVLGVHHGGKEAGRGPRGHESLHGATDFEFEVTGAQGDTPNLWKVVKNKSAPVHAFHKFRLKQRVVGADEDGDPITSCVVIDLDGAAEVQAPVEDRRFNLKDKQREFCQALVDAIDLHGHAVPPDLAAGNNVSMVAQWDDIKRIYNERLAILESGDEQQVYERLRKRWNEALKDLLRFKVIGSKKPYAWFTGKPLKNFTIRGAAEYKPRAGEHAQALPPDDEVMEKELPF